MSANVFDGPILNTRIDEKRPKSGRSSGSLSQRELEVFERIGRGLSTSEIAKQLNISVKAIETHREKIKRKLGLSSAAELTRYAMEWDLEQD